MNMYELLTSKLYFSPVLIKTKLLAVALSKAVYFCATPPLRRYIRRLGASYSSHFDLACMRYTTGLRQRGPVRRTLVSRLGTSFGRLISTEVLMILLKTYLNMM